MQATQVRPLLDVDSYTCLHVVDVMLPRECLYVAYASSPRDILSTGPNLYYDGYVSYDFAKIQFRLMQISSGS